MSKEMSILEKAGLPDPEKVFDGKGHVKNVFLRNFALYPEEMEEIERSEIDRHLIWCRECQERRKQGFLPMEEEQ